MRVCPATSRVGAALYLVYPSARQLPARVSAFRDFLTAQCSKHWHRVHGGPQRPIGMCRGLATSSPSHSSPSRVRPRRSSHTGARCCWWSTWPAPAASPRNTRAWRRCGASTASAGLVVLGFPCNQFGKQEPGGAERDPAASAKHEYAVTFPLFAKIEVNGAGTHPLYRLLRSAPRACSAPRPSSGTSPSSWSTAGRGRRPLRHDHHARRRSSPRSKSSGG